MKKLLAAALVAVSLLTASVAQAATHYFYVHNRTSVTISYLYLSPTNTQIPWSNDILGTDTLLPGYQQRFVYTDGAGTGDYCFYDVLAKTASGAQYGGYINLCSTDISGNGNIYLTDADYLRG